MKSDAVLKLLAILMLSSTSLHAQWLNEKAKGIPRLPDGAPERGPGTAFPGPTR